MNPTGTLATLQDIFRKAFSAPALVLTRETTAADVPGWDSFTHITLISQIEANWKLRFSLEELQSLQRVGDIVDLLDQKGSSASRAS